MASLLLTWLRKKKINLGPNVCTLVSLIRTKLEKSFLNQGDDNEIHKFEASESPRKMCTYKQLSRVIAGRVDVATCKYTRVFYFSCYVVQHKMPPYLQLRIGRFAQKIECTECAIFGMRALKSTDSRSIPTLGDNIISKTCESISPPCFILQKELCNATVSLFSIGRGIPPRPKRNK